MECFFGLQNGVTYPIFCSFQLFSLTTKLFYNILTNGICFSSYMKGSSYTVCSTVQAFVAIKKKHPLRWKIILQKKKKKIAKYAVKTKNLPAKIFVVTETNRTFFHTIVRNTKLSHYIKTM